MIQKFKETEDSICTYQNELDKPYFMILAHLKMVMTG